MSSNATITLKPIGDVELWYAEPADCSWRLPVHVEWKQDPSDGKNYGLIIPGTCFYHLQTLAINTLLGSHSLEDRSDRWLIPKDRIETLLRKAPGIHAEFYYDWPDAEQPPIPAQHGLSVMMRQTQAAQFASFAEFVSSERHIPADVVNMVLMAVRQAGPKWLLKYRQPIELGFARLVAFPFRANWKEIILFKCKPWSIRSIFNLPKEKRLARLNELGFPGIACSVHNTGLSGKRTLLPHLEYSLEVIPDKAFEMAVHEIESERLRAGRTSYVAQFEEAVEELYEHIIDALAHYSKKVGSSWAAVREVRMSGILAFLPVGGDTSKSKVRGVSLARLPVHIVPPHSDFSVYAEGKGKSDQHLVQAQDEAMRKVSALPSALIDLRQCSGNGDLE